jgi:hypothetical protein
VGLAHCCRAAKNVILAGVNSVVLLDDGKAEIADLGAQVCCILQLPCFLLSLAANSAPRCAQFYLKPKDVGHPRAKACESQLVELNR